MNGVTMQSMPSGLLAKKGAAKPAMRRQNQIQQAGFGSGSLAGMSGWLTGAEDDCGWNDMGDTPQAAPAASVIGLTPVKDTGDSLYLHSNGEDWDEAEGYDEDQRAEPGWQPAAPVASAPLAANPVGAMQDRLRDVAAPTPSYAAPAPASSYAAPVYEEPAGPVGLFGSIKAGIAHLVAMITGRGPILVVHPDHKMREMILDAAAREGVSEVEIAERAIAKYCKPAKSGFTSNVMGNA